MTEKPPTPLTRDAALQALEKHLKMARNDLATRMDAGPQVLTYLASHGADATRAAVAANPVTPAETNLALTRDASEEVREALANKIGRLFPGMLLAEEEHLRDLTLQTLQKLAEDEAGRVRAVLAETVKHLDNIPKAIAQKLARDSEEAVSTPILEYSPLIDDGTLIEIVTAAEANAVLEAVARRKGLTDRVSDAVVATHNTGAIATLLQNIDASIRKGTLDKIVSQAAEIAEWHGPLVMRAELSSQSIRRLTEFVGASLIRTLAERNQLDGKTRKFLEEKLTEYRKEYQSGPAVSRSDDILRQASADVEAAFASGTLNDVFVTRAIADHRRETIICALSRLAHADPQTVRTILDSQGARPLTALVWKAGLNMRTAYKIQTTVMHLTGDKLLPARGGTDFPMTEEEMHWQLSCVGLEKS